MLLSHYTFQNTGRPGQRRTMFTILACTPSAQSSTMMTLLFKQDMMQRYSSKCPTMEDIMIHCL